LAEALRVVMLDPDTVKRLRNPCLAVVVDDDGSDAGRAAAAVALYPRLLRREFALVKPKDRASEVAARLVLQKDVLAHDADARGRVADALFRKRNALVFADHAAVAELANLAAASAADLVLATHRSGLHVLAAPLRDRSPANLADRAHRALSDIAAADWWPPASAS